MNDSFYFPHDNNSFNDDKILAIRAEFGLEGYGLFWSTLESMSRSDGYIIPPLIGGLSLGYGVAIETLSNFLEFCVKIELFKKDEKGYYSQRMIEHLEQRKLFKESGKRGAEKRWKDRGANGGANGRKGKERKEEERKGKEIISNKLDKKEYIKKKFLDFVLLTEEEHKNLLSRFPEAVDTMIEKLNNYIGSTGKVYKSHYHTILNWASKEGVVSNNGDMITVNGERMTRERYKILEADKELMSAFIKRTKDYKLTNQK